jgi:RNA polymerase sigma factor (sigma-70 family)
MSENDAVNSRNRHRPFWEKFIEDSKDRLKAKALRFMNGNVHDAEDLMQETVCRILMYPRNPKTTRSPIGYLSTIMRNIWITKWHKEDKAKMESLDELLSKEAQEKRHKVVEPAVEPEALRILESDERRAEMRAKLGLLTSREKLLLTLYLEDYTCKEIAHKLNEDVRLVRSDLNAVRTKVRSRLMKAKAQKLR